MYKFLHVQSIKVEGDYLVITLNFFIFMYKIDLNLFPISIVLLVKGEVK
jgi:hypothetical protein